MRRGNWSTAGFCVGLTALLLVSAGEASACSQPESGWRPSSFIPGPANGVMLLGYSCYVDCNTAPRVDTLSLKSDEGEVIPGRVVFSYASDSYVQVAFRPEPGVLREGGVYTAELEGVAPFTGLLVGPALTWNDALTPTIDIFEVDHPTGDTQCCGGPIDSCGGTPCFLTQVERRTTVSVGWQEELSLEHDQYVFRLGRDGIEPTMPWSWSGGATRFELDEAEDGACFVLELKRLVDDSVQTFESRCVERPTTFMPGLRPTPADDIARVLNGCDEPPPGYEVAWCEARKETCESSPDEPWCLEFAARCASAGAAGAGGETSVAGAPATSDTGGASHTGGGDGEAGAAGRAAEGERVFTEGCGCSVPRRSSGDPAALGLGLLLGLVARRRVQSA